MQNTECYIIGLSMLLFAFLVKIQNVNVDMFGLVCLGFSQKAGERERERVESKAKE